MPAKYTKWTNIWKNLTLLDSSQLEVFLAIFWKFFIFLNSNLNFKFGPVWNRPKPELVRTGLTGNHGFRTGSGRFFQSWRWYSKCVRLLTKLYDLSAKEVANGVAWQLKFHLWVTRKAAELNDPIRGSGTYQYLSLQELHFSNLLMVRIREIIINSKANP